MPDDTIKVAHSIDAATSNSHNLHHTMTRKPQKCAGLKENLLIIWQPKTTYITPLVLPTTGAALNRLHDSLKLISLRPALYVTMQKIAVIDTCRTLR